MTGLPARQSACTVASSRRMSRVRASSRTLIAPKAGEATDVTSLTNFTAWSRLATDATRHATGVDDGRPGTPRHARLSESRAQILERGALGGRRERVVEKPARLGGKPLARDLVLQNLGHDGATGHDVGQAGPRHSYEQADEYLGDPRHAV